jgi:PAS domain S-box-containing protein
VVRQDSGCEGWALTHLRKEEPSQNPPFLAGGGEMAALIAARDWSNSLGPPSAWPQSLQTTMGMLLRATLPIVLLWGEDGIMLYNDAYSVFAGGRHPRLLGSKVREGWPEVAAFNDNVMRVGLAGGTLAYKNQELTLYRHGRPEQVWMNLDYSPVLGESGRAAGVIAFVVETTERVLADRRAAAEQARQRDLFDQMPGFVAVMMGPEHVFEYVNDAYVKISERSRFIGRTIRDVFPDLAGQGFYELIDKVYATGEAVVVRAMELRLHGSEEIQYIDFVYQPIRDVAGAITGVFVGGYEVTQAYRVAEALRKSEASLRELNAELERKVVERTQARGLTWQVSPDLMGALNSQGYFETSNPAWQTILGWSEDEVAGMSIFELLHPDDVERTREGFNLTQIGQPAIRFPNRYRCKDGGYRWISWVGVPEDGMVYCVGRDITEERAAQDKLMEAQEALRQAQKMEAVGQLTGGIAHDFNNLLQGIGGALERVQSRIADGRLGDVDRFLKAAIESVNRAASLTHRLLAFSRRQTLDPRTADLNKLISGMHELVSRTMGPNVTVEVVGAIGLWQIRVDASQLESSLLNLCINARDAMPDGGRLIIETGNKWLDERAAREREIAPGQYVSLCVTDSGTGMTPEVIARAFDPFYTTKPLGRGTGLGLSMVYGFVRQSGGQVRIYSEAGKGTTMCLYFPRHVGSSDEDALPEREHAERGLGETILVVDDDATVRMLIAEVLLERSYNVLEAIDGPAAMRILESDAKIDLLITDVGLPGGMNGRQVADAARLGRGDLKVLFITGYAENAAVGNGYLEPGMEVLTKPFPMAALGNKVHDMIEG